jgi:hypothetical protein
MIKVAKTIMVYASFEDLEKAKEQTPWLWFLQSLGGTDITDFSVADGLTVTRLWTDKACAEEYIRWVERNLDMIDVYLVSITLEDLPA